MTGASSAALPVPVACPMEREPRVDGGQLLTSQQAWRSRSRQITAGRDEAVTTVSKPCAAVIQRVGVPGTM